MRSTSTRSRAWFALLSLCVGTFLGTVTEAHADSGSPIISALSSTELRRSGRFRIFGSGFGAAQGTVNIAGIPTPVSQWGDTEIHAYVLGTAALGAADISVLTTAGTSNSVTVQIDDIEATTGRVRWRFQVDSNFILHRPAVAADDSVYVNDKAGLLYALDPNGGLRWIYDTGGQGGEGPVAIGQDGTVYVAGNPAGEPLEIHAVGADGTANWVFTTTGQEVIAGPNIGPDGNLYVVADPIGPGAFSLSPAGDLLWSRPGFTDFGALGAEIVFSAGQLYVCLDGFLEALGLNGQRHWLVDVGAQTRQPAVGPDGTLYIETSFTGEGRRLRAYDPDGTERWMFFDSGTNTLSAPDVGPDGTVYISRNVTRIHAINPDGSERWLHQDEDSFGDGPYEGPVASPDGSKVLIGANVDPGNAGVIKAVSSQGTPLWEVLLPRENNWNISPTSRPIFNADGTTAFIGTNGPQSDFDYSYLYAIDSSDEVASASLLNVLNPVGTLVAGSVTSLHSSDDERVIIQSAPLGSNHGTSAVVIASAAGIQSSNMDLQVELSGSTSATVASVALRNFALGTWESIDSFVLPTADTNQSYQLNDAQRFVRAADGAVALQVRSRSAASHELRIDQVGIQFTQ